MYVLCMYVPVCWYIYIYIYSMDCGPIWRAVVEPRPHVPSGVV